MVMQVPMRLKETRTIDSGCASPEQIKERLNRWAARYKFTNDSPEAGDFDDAGKGDLLYRRGSHWQAFYTFDIRKVPTVVRVVFHPSHPGQVTCSMECGSWLQFSTAADTTRVSEQMDLLEACLKGALS
jgi:hypothetical protein